MHGQLDDPYTTSVSSHHSSLTPHCPQIHTRLAHECHTVSIRLAAQIWATAHCDSYSKSHPPTRSRSSVVLPSHLAHILPPSLSYPSFSLSFS